jgi:thymidylate synthase ThyX
MQASDQAMDAETEAIAKEIWEEMARVCAKGVLRLNELGLHKQWANRPLEWFGTITTVMTATSYENFFELRDHKDAQPEINHLAVLMKKAMAESEPAIVGIGDWHLPYILDEERNAINSLDTLLKMSTARCARVSYLTQEGTVPSIEKDLALFERLVGSKPLHASPCEHQATPKSWLEGDNDGLNANFDGWKQHRKILEANDNLSNI